MTSEATTPKGTTPKPTGRRGSARLEAMKIAADLAHTPTRTPEAKPVKKVVSNKKAAAEKKATEKITANKKAAKKTDAAPKPTTTKCKSPSPSADDLEGKTEIGTDETPSKKSKPSPKDEPAKVNKADTDTLDSKKAPATTIATQVSRSVRSALNHYLEILDPFMQFQMLCNNRNADSALGQEIEVMRVTVLDLVRELQTKDACIEEEMEEEDDEEF